MSAVAAFPQESPSWAGRRKGSLEGGREGGEAGPLSPAVEGGVRDTPSWKGASDICILLGV